MTVPYFHIEVMNITIKHKSLPIIELCRFEDLEKIAVSKGAYIFHMTITKLIGDTLMHYRQEIFAIVVDGILYSWVREE